MDRYDWIIGICNSEKDGVELLRYRGNKEEMKEKLVSLIHADRLMDKELWEYGCESSDDIQVEDNGLGYELYGYGNYINYHIDYTAKEFAHIDYTV